MAIKPIVNERSTALVDVAFWDEDGVAATPSAASYRIDNASSGTAVLASTALTGLAPTMTIEITPTQNAMGTATNPVEERVVTVDWTYGSARRGTDEYRYLLRNLGGIPLA